MVMAIVAGHAAADTRTIDVASYGGAVLGLVLSHLVIVTPFALRLVPATSRGIGCPVRLFLYIRDDIHPLVCSISALLIAVTTIPMFGLDRLVLGSHKG